MLKDTCLVLTRRVYGCDTTLSIPYYIVQRWRCHISSVGKKLYSENNYYRSITWTDLRGRKKTLVKIHLYYVSESVCRVKINVSWKQYGGEIILHASEFYKLSVEMNGIEI